MDNNSKNDTIWHFSLKKHHLKYALIILVTFFVSVVGSIIVILSINDTATLGVTHERSITPIEEKITAKTITQQINKIRTKNNLKSLETSAELANAAREKATDMLEKNYWNDISPNGSQPWKFITDTEYKYIDASILLGQGHATLEELINAWMNNERNKSDILSKNYEDIGIHVQKNNNDDTTVTVFIASGGVISTTDNFIKSPKTKTVQKQVNINTDPNVSCTFAHAPSKQMPKSQCNISFECQIGGQWYIYTSKDQCSKDQQAGFQGTGSSSNQSTSSNRSSVFISYGGYTMSCPSQNVGAAMSINSTLEAKKMEWAKSYNDCADRFYESDSCFVSCKSTSGNGYSVCSQSYNYSTAEYEACTKEHGDKYSACIASCPSARQSCDYVYAEQKSLISQLNNLCK